MGPGAWAGRRQRGVGRDVVQAGEDDGDRTEWVGQRRDRAGQNRAHERQQQQEAHVEKISGRKTEGCSA